MSKQGGQKLRKDNMDRIILLVKNTEGGIHNDKLVAAAKYYLGITDKKIREYLDILSELGKLQFNSETGIWTLKVSKEE